MNPNQKKTPESQTHFQKKSLEKIHGSITTQYPSLWKRIFAFAGPAYWVSIGYMDPGNW
jgi:manganese transport protein